MRGYVILNGEAVSLQNTKKWGLGTFRRLGFDEPTVIFY